LAIRVSRLGRRFLMPHRLAVGIERHHPVALLSEAQ
jgi:hypothetical protein